MKTMAGIAAGGLIVIAAHARVAAPEAPDLAPAVPDLSDWTRPMGGPADVQAPTPPPVPIEEAIDVVDAHWMALTMWGEARNEGEAGMRAVGHVIRNRQEKAGDAAFVTDTVSEAWQFSCWNEGDPNREKMLNIDLLPKDSEDYRLWLSARRVAAEILSDRSLDPTGGALFYHTDAVAPAWSRGVTPVARIGSHLFFRAVR